eukprot:TRINITY_DN17989_c0_g1_i1.p3 TRINITY_DN17989_c0_g1~~TRINITY_DN17989_c0_g1_i1.p3  ORF type:complete len:180 (-),score=19.20 TRINITY_DN17989_c0_g1_i1:505-1044(-)
MSFRSNILSQKHLTGVSSIQPRFVKCLSNQIQPTLRVRTRRNEVRNSAASVDASVPAESAAQDIKGDVVKASPFNNPLVRGLSLGLVLLALGRGTGFLSTSWLAFCNVSAYGIWVGSMYMYELEATPEGRKEKDKIQYLYKEFSKLHGLSSLLNLVSFLAVVTHGWWLAKNLAVSVPLL